ncbi:NUDIX domain-containing protein [Actinoplanes sp. OR16]|uniref:NUDIX domain-containing protein n=1 Tax=Actinoplanes sp. OR16 TaxID=946334 RepID=UPI0026D0E81F
MTVGARAVLRDPDGRVLLIKRSDNGRWALPAGTMELGQTLHDCAIRETDETTDAAFYPVGALPDGTTHSVHASLADLARFEAGAPFLLA